MNRSISVRQELRPRFWYFTFVNCGVESLEPITFTIHAVNMAQGFEEEFGADAVGSLQLEVLFCALFFLVGGSVACLECCRKKPLNTSAGSLLRLLGASAASSALGCGCRALHHLAFAYDGKGMLAAAVLGTFL